MLAECVNYLGCDHQSLKSDRNFGSVAAGCRRGLTAPRFKQGEHWVLMTVGAGSDRGTSE